VRSTGLSDFHVSALQGQSGKKTEHSFPLSASRLMAVDYNGKICNDYPHAKNLRAAGTIPHAVKNGYFLLTSVHKIRDSWFGIIRLRAGQQKNPGSTPCRCKRFLSKASRHVQGPTSLPLIVYRSLLPGGRGGGEERSGCVVKVTTRLLIPSRFRISGTTPTLLHVLMVSTGTVVSLLCPHNPTCTKIEQHTFHKNEFIRAR